MQRARVLGLLSLWLTLSCGGDDRPSPAPGCPELVPTGSACVLEGTTCEYGRGFCPDLPTLARYTASCADPGDGTLAWRVLESSCTAPDGGPDAGTGDAGPMNDGGPDGGLDGGRDGGVDAGRADAGGTDAGGSDGGAGLPTGTSGCTSHDQCASGVCWDFAMYDPFCGGTVCSETCATDADCQAAASAARAASPERATCGSDLTCDLVGTGLGLFFCT